MQSFARINVNLWHEFFHELTKSLFDDFLILTPHKENVKDLEEQIEGGIFLE